MRIYPPPAQTPFNSTTKTRVRIVAVVATLVGLVSLLVAVTGFPLKQLTSPPRTTGTSSPTAARFPQLSPVSHLTAISMVSPTEGWAAGANYANTAHWNTLLLHFHSGSWTSLTPTQASILPNAVAMDSVSDGWVGGASSFDADTAVGVMLHYDGQAWVSFPLPAGTNAITSITALSETDAWAVDATPSQKHAHILHFSGGVWTIAKTMSDSEVLQSISMVNPNEGWVAGRGSYNPGLNGTPGALWHYLHGTWQRVTPSGPHHAAVEYVSMLPSGEGWGIGSYQVSSATPNQDYIPQAAMIWHLTGSQWQAVMPIVDKTGTALATAVVAGESNDVWVGASQDSLSRILHCTGGGHTCSDQPTSPTSVAAIAMDSADDGWAVGNGAQLVHCFQQRCMLTTP